MIQDTSKKQRRAARARHIGLTIAIVAVVVMVNVILNALATKFSWYLYTEEYYEHTIADAADTRFAALQGAPPVTVLFCMPADELEADAVYRLPYRTACQLAERYDFIEIKHVNIYLNPEEVAPYRQQTDPLTGETATLNIGEQSVIFVSGENYRVESLESFFLLDENNSIIAYIGEEQMTAYLSWVRQATHPVAAFTYTHGENYQELGSFYTALLALGYEVKQIDPALDPIDSDVSLLIVANPLYDLDRAAPGSGVVTEYERINDFLARGGALFVSLDPYVKSSLPNLSALLQEAGLATDGAVIRDDQNSITTDGYTLITDYAVNAEASALAGAIAPNGSPRVILREASAIQCQSNAIYTVHPLLLSSPSAVTYRDGKVENRDGSYPVFAASTRENPDGSTGTVLLSTGVFLLANDVLSSANYANRSLIFATLSRYADGESVVGSTLLPIAGGTLEDMTIAAARRWTLLVAVAVPLSVAVTGTVLLLRRRRG